MRVKNGNEEIKAKILNSQFSNINSYYGRMAIRILTDQANLIRYDAWIKAHPHGSLWQSLEWKAFQESLGREVHMYIDELHDEIISSALVIIDTNSMKLTTWDIPRGPVKAMSSKQETGSMDMLLMQIMEDAKASNVMSLFLSPQEPLTADHLPLTTSNRHQQPDATIMVDLRLPLDDILNQMHTKGRYNIRLAEKKGIVVEQSADVYAFTQLIKKTSDRDGFTPPTPKTYETFLRNLPGSFLLLAYAPGIDAPIGGLMGVIWNGTGVYYYGGSDHEHRALMAPYAMQWTAMQFCKLQGCHSYDLFGIAPSDAVDHPWSGVTDFKRKFGGTVITYPPEQQIILRPWTTKALALKRKLFG